MIAASPTAIPAAQSSASPALAGDPGSERRRRTERKNGTDADLSFFMSCRVSIRVSPVKRHGSGIGYNPGHARARGSGAGRHFPGRLLLRLWGVAGRFRGLGRAVAFGRSRRTLPARRRSDRGCLRVKMGKQAGPTDLDKWLEYDPIRARRPDLDCCCFGERAPTQVRGGSGKLAEEGGVISPRSVRRRACLVPGSADEERLAGTLGRVWKLCKPRPGFPPPLKRYLAQAPFMPAAAPKAAVATTAARYCPGARRPSSTER